MSNKKPAAKTLSIEDCLAELESTIGAHPDSDAYRVSRKGLRTISNLGSLSLALSTDTLKQTLPPAVANRLLALIGRVLKLKGG